MRWPIPIAMVAAFGLSSAAAQSLVDVEVDAVESDVGGSGVAAAPARLPVNLSASVSHHAPVVTDEDPANDQRMSYGLRAKAKITDRSSVFVRGGVTQSFVDESGESGLNAQDSRLGAQLKTPIDLGGWKELSLMHTLQVWLPTSRASQRQDLYFASQYSAMASLEPVANLTVSLRPWTRYRFHKYAERAGLHGDMATQFELGTNLGVDYALFKFEHWGTISAGGSTGTSWHKQYASRDDHESATSDQDMWNQHYGWEAHASYEPFAALSINMTLDQSGSVLRNGVVNTFLAKREETQLITTISARY